MNLAEWKMDKQCKRDEEGNDNEIIINNKFINKLNSGCMDNMQTKKSHEKEKGKKNTKFSCLKGVGR